MPKIYVNIPDRSACGYYRAIGPVENCKADLPDIELICSNQLDLSDNYDAYMFHRIFQQGFLKEIEALKAKGKKLIWEIDDDMWNVPPWNPSSSNFMNPELDMLNYTIDLADMIIVTNEALKNVVNRPEKTIVAPNLIDPKLYPGFKNHRNPKVRILWAGSNYHEGDLKQLNEPLKYILDKYDVQVLFFGDIPDGLSVFKRIRNSNLGILTPDPKYSPKLGFISPVALKEYPKILASIEPDIALCPLEDTKFNESKSNIKWMEYTLCNAATICSRVGPYKDICTTYGGTTQQWIEAIEELFEVEYREHMAAHARNIIIDQWSWLSPKKQIWLDLFKKAVNL